MKLPAIPFLKKSGTSEYILVLLLRQEKANAVIVEKDKKTLRIINQHEEFFSSDLETASNEEWLDILDTAISRAEEKLPPSIETHQTIFGLPNSWVEDKQIKKEYLSKLKHASDELDLKPIGFIEIPEAIAHLIREKEGAPVSALIAEIGKKHVVVSLAKAGAILTTKTAVIQESPVQTVDAVLKKFTEVEVLPPRLIIYNGKDIDDLTQSFITHRWSKSIPFVHHVPQVSVLEKGFDVTSVVTGAAEQLGVVLTGGAIHMGDASIKNLDSGTDHGASHEEPDEESSAGEESFEEVSAASFGFVIGKDINELPENEIPDDEMPTEDESGSEEDTPDTYKSDNLIDADQKLGHPREDDESDDAEPEYAAPPSPMVNQDFDTGGRQVSSKAGNILSKFTGFLPSSLPSVFSGILGKLPGNNSVKNRAFLLIPLFLIVLIVLGILYTSLVKATVEVNVRPEVVEREEDVIFTTDGSSDFGENIIQAKTTTITVSGEASTRATGEEETGEKAKGTVTIFNSSTSKKELAQGTVITSSNDLDFVLDKEVIIASASGDIFSGIESGTAKVPVTAANIGKEYNIPSNTTFDIASDNNLAARNDEAFSGGTKEEITVVSANDIAKLTKDLPNSLTKQAEDQLMEKLGREEILLSVYADFSPQDSDFSSSEGDEATNVTLSADVEFVGIFYDNSELVEYTKSLIQDDFSDDLTLDESGISVTASDIEEDDGDYLATIAIEAKLLPKIETDKLKEEFQGKSFEEVNKQFEDLPQVINTKITLFPPIPFLPQLMPRKSSNIDIIVSAND